MSRKVVILADKQIEELKGQTFDIIALPVRTQRFLHSLISVQTFCK